MQIPLGIRKQSLLRRKSAILSARFKFYCIAKIFWRYAYTIWQYLVGRLIWARIRSKKLIRSVNCIHKGQKCIQILWGHQNEISFLENYKECTICAIIREIPYFV